MRLGFTFAMFAAFTVACSGSDGGGEDTGEGPRPDALADLGYDGAEAPDASIEDATDGDLATTDVEGELADVTECDYAVSANGFRDNCDGTVTDTSTGRMWMTRSVNGASYTTVAQLCNAAQDGGYEDWHLATIDELREIVLDCTATTSGGTCGVTNLCWEETCWTEAACGGCAMKGGPGDNGCYTDPTLFDQCNLVISSTKVKATYTGDIRAWYMTFYDGRVAVNPAGVTIVNGFGRCAR